MTYETNPEISANILGERVHFLILGIFVLVAVFTITGLFAVDSLLVLILLLCQAVVSIPVVFVSRLTNRRARCLPYLHVAAAFIAPCASIVIDAFAMTISFAVPLGLTCCYLNRRLLWGMAVVMPFLSLLAIAGNLLWGYVDPALTPLPADAVVAWRSDIGNVVREVGFDRMGYFLNMVRFGLLPNLLAFYIAVLLADGAIRYGRRRVESSEAFSRGLLDTLGRGARR